MFNFLNRTCVVLARISSYKVLFNDERKNNGSTCTYSYIQKFCNCCKGSGPFNINKLCLTKKINYGLHNLTLL